MQLQSLTAISPIDGRYRDKVEHLDAYFSEFALVKYRVEVEVAYFLFLAEQKLFKISPAVKKKWQGIVADFSLEDAEKIKQTELITNHDVKAVEYFLKEKLIGFGGEDLQEWIHFGLTSQDINNTAIPRLWKDAIEYEYLPGIINLQHELQDMALSWKKVTLLARTHGQPASPTTLGKEIMVFVERLENQVQLFSFIPFTGKFGGATGNFNAHYAAYPKKNWHGLADKFLQDKLALQRQQYTTQIEHYDLLAAHFDNIKRINTILLDLCRDMWTYVSMDYFKQKIRKNETGSSAMPHKVNPIDFENAEGNLGIANALLEHLSAKLPVSRLQRDLTDSTVIRNIGVPIAHTMLAFSSIEKGLKKLILNEEKINADLEDNWAVVTEAIQTILRREKYPKPYEALKDLSRNNNKMTKEVLHKFIDTLKINTSVKKELKKISPVNYTGVCNF
ncbi:MAG: adenylosuccinate lyase [Ginsengibacter sp.]